jgi:hypothetical protein
MTPMKICFVSMVILFLTFSYSFGGILTGTLNPASTCGYGVGFLGGYAGLGDDATTLFGMLSYGFSDYTEGRLKLGFSDPDEGNANPRLLIGADLKYQFMDYNSKSKRQPFDMAIAGFFEYVDYDGSSYLQLGGNFIASIPYRLSSGQRLIPYAALNLRLDRNSNHDPHHGSHSDFEGGVNLGAKYELTQEMNIYGELQIDDNTAFFTGLEFRIF